MKVITFNNKFDPGYYRFLKTANKFDYEIIRCPGYHWSGFFGRWESILIELEKLPEEEVVIVSDSSDVVFLRDFTKKEIDMIAESDEIFAAKHTPVPYLKRFFGFNAGVIVAKAGILKGLAMHIIDSGAKDKFEDCDQSFINNCVIKQELFLRDAEFIYLNCCFKDTLKDAAIYHYIGATDFLHLKTRYELFRIGFKNTSDIKLDPKKFLSYFKKYFIIESRARKEANV